MRFCRRLLAGALVAGAAARDLSAQQGLTYGISLGVARATLRPVGTGAAVRSIDLALGWHAGWQVSDRMAILLSASSAVYPSSRSASRRKRGFETVMPTIEYRLADGLRVHAGAGLQLDAPVFWDSAPLNPGERRFSRGWGMVFGASYAPRRMGTVGPELRARWNGGFAETPAGRLQGQTAALLLGVRHDPH